VQDATSIRAFELFVKQISGVYFMKNAFVSVLAVSAIALATAGTSEARPIREGNRYWEFSQQEVSSVMGQFGLRRYWGELNRRCNEGHRTQNKPWWRTGRFDSANNRFFCTY
jgi:hypothetical protein